MGTIIVVHGTGVRLKGYLQSFALAKEQAAGAKLADALVECAWGDALGVEFQGLSLPDPPSEARQKEELEDFARWRGLLDDPLAELFTLTIPEPRAKALEMPGQKPAWQARYDKVRAYAPSDECKLLLERASLQAFWQKSFAEVMDNPITLRAFQASAHELHEATAALARAVIAQLHVDTTQAGQSGPSRTLRNSLFDRLLFDWEGKVLGLGKLLGDLFARKLTAAARTHRETLSHWAAYALGDVLLYQARGATIRAFIQSKVANANPPVTLVAHSLGGIACVDLLALEYLPTVRNLVTIGSQAPLLCELGALASLKSDQPLPATFPRWLNVYDRNDLLSYVAGRLWPQVEDFEVVSGQAAHEAHGAYFGNAEVWAKIQEFIAS